MLQWVAGSCDNCRVRQLLCYRGCPGGVWHEGRDGPYREGLRVGMAADSDSFGALLKRERAAARLTQAELWRRSGVSEREIRERGVHQSARNQTVQLLGDALGLAGDRRERFERAGRGDADLAAGDLTFREPIIR